MPEAASLSVDVVIDNYNYDRYLAAAIDSVLGQSHPRVRAIVVDDGSTDASRSIIAGYGEQIVPVLQENGGQAAAMNAGFECVDADIVIFLDSDDALVPDAAALAAEAFAREPDTTRVQWRMTVIDAAGEPTGAVMPAEHLPMVSGDQRRAQANFPFDMTWMSGTSGSAYSVAALRRIMPIPAEPFRRNADWYLQHLPPLMGPVCSLNDHGALRRLHGDNSYEPTVAELELGHVRQTIRFAAVTRPQIERLADELGVQRPPGPVLSVSDLANRLVSLRLEPEQHPVTGDRRGALASAGLRAAGRRFDVHPAMRAAFCSWFVLMAIAPRPLARPLAAAFLFPERRGGLNSLLGRLHRGASR